MNETEKVVRIYRNDNMRINRGATIETDTELVQIETTVRILPKTSPEQMHRITEIADEALEKIIEIMRAAEECKPEEKAEGQESPSENLVNEYLQMMDHYKGEQTKPQHDIHGEDQP